MDVIQEAIRSYQLSEKEKNDFKKLERIFADRLPEETEIKEYKEKAKALNTLQLQIAQDRLTPDEEEQLELYERVIGEEIPKEHELMHYSSQWGTRNQIKAELPLKEKEVQDFKSKIAQSKAEEKKTTKIKEKKIKVKEKRIKQKDEDEETIREIPPFVKKLIIFIIIVVAAFISYSMLIEPNLLQVKEYKIESNKISDSFHGLKVIQISDINYGTSFNETDLDRTITKINELKPDIVLFTGNLIDKNIKIDEKNKKTLITYLSAVKFESEQIRKDILEDLGIDSETFKYKFTIDNLLYKRSNYKIIDCNIIQNNQRLIEEPIYIFACYYDSSQDCYGPCLGLPDDYIYGIYENICNVWEAKKEYQ